MDNQHPDIKLIRKAQAGNIEARNALIVRHERFIWMIVRESLGHRSHLAEEYFAIGVEAFMRAIRGFRAEKAGSLLTYAGIMIKRSVWKSINGDTPVKRSHKPPKAPDAKERWERAGSASDILTSTAGDLHVQAVDERMSQAEDSELVQRYMAALSATEQRVLYLRYCVDMAPQQISAELGGLSVRRIRGIELGAIRRMRRRGLSEVLDSAAAESR